MTHQVSEHVARADRVDRDVLCRHLQGQCLQTEGTAMQNSMKCMNPCVGVYPKQIEAAHASGHRWCNAQGSPPRQAACLQPHASQWRQVQPRQVQAACSRSGPQHTAHVQPVPTGLASLTHTHTINSESRLPPCLNHQMYPKQAQAFCERKSESPW